MKCIQREQEINIEYRQKLDEKTIVSLVLLSYQKKIKKKKIHLNLTELANCHIIVACPVIFDVNFTIPHNYKYNEHSEEKKQNQKPPKKPQTDQPKTLTLQLLNSHLAL